MRGSGKGAGLSSGNTVGMEIIAKDDRDVLPIQKQRFVEFMRKNYPNTPVFGLRAGGHGMDPARIDWCASFVSSALHHAGYRDIPQIREGYKGGDIANAYQTWGTPVAAKDVRRGDVVITTKGKRPGQEGGHISIATGPLDKDNEIPVIEGDVRVDPRRGGRHMVKRDWETPRAGVVYRRPPEPDQAPTREAKK